MIKEEKQDTLEVSNKISEENNLQQDDVVNDILEQIKESREGIKDVVDKMMHVIKDYFNENSEIKSSELVKRAYIAAAGVIFSISQGFYENEEEYFDDLEKIRELGTNDIYSTIMKMVEKDQDMLAYYKIMMAIAASIDYLFWQNDFSKYSQLRAEKESAQK